MQKLGTPSLFSNVVTNSCMLCLKKGGALNHYGLEDGTEVAQKVLSMGQIPREQVLIIYCGGEKTTKMNKNPKSGEVVERTMESILGFLESKPASLQLSFEHFSEI